MEKGAIGGLQREDTDVKEPRDVEEDEMSSFSGLGGLK